MENDPKLLPDLSIALYLFQHFTRQMPCYSLRPADAA